MVSEHDERLQRISGKYEDAGEASAKKFMQRDSKAPEKYGQRVSDAFHLSDFFVDNTEKRILKDNKPNPKWEVSQDLERLTMLVTHAAVARPTTAETAMHAAAGAAMRSACMSRQVGAALVDRDGNLIATGTNEAPKAGGGVYGSGFVADEEIIAVSMETNIAATLPIKNRSRRSSSKKSWATIRGRRTRNFVRIR